MSEKSEIAFRQESEFAMHPSESITGFDSILDATDESCPGFHQCADRAFEGGRVDCEECKEDALSAMAAVERGP